MLKFPLLILYIPIEVSFVSLYLHSGCLLKMCGFPLAEERKRRKTFLSHMAESLGSEVRGVSGHEACVRLSIFVLPSAIA